MPHLPTPTRRPRAGTARALAALVTLALGAGACGSSGRSAPGSSLNHDLITLQEIQQSPAANAYDLITQVRPNWLRGRGTPSFRNRAVDLPVVYLGDRPQGPVDILRSFATASLAELRYINATTATTRYGEGHAGGVIEVVLLRR